MVLRAGPSLRIRKGHTGNHFCPYTAVVGLGRIVVSEPVRSHDVPKPGKRSARNPRLVANCGLRAARLENNAIFLLLRSTPGVLHRPIGN